MILTNYSHMPEFAKLTRPDCQKINQIALEKLENLGVTFTIS